MLTRGTFLETLNKRRGCGKISAGMDLICDYAGARHFLIARYDLRSDAHLDCILASDWPFDLVRTLGVSLINSHARRSEYGRCLTAFEPVFIDVDDAHSMPQGLARRICLIPFNSGEARMLLLLIFEDGLFLSNDRLRDVAMAMAYHASNFPEFVSRSERVADLTDREIECLAWIGEGKTSDEMATIIGISRNTINNYITSIMNKTGAKTRSEAVAFGVRNQII